MPRFYLWLTFVSPVLWGPLWCQVPRFAYVANSASASVSAYTIEATTGALIPVPGSSFQTVAGPNSVAVDPTRRFLYVANGVPDALGTVSGYIINPITGALTPISGSPFPAGIFPYSVTVDPTGRFCFVANQAVSSGDVSAYSINAGTGALTPVPGSPFPTGGSRPVSVTVDPTGRFTYVANLGTTDISGFAINGTTGSLTPVPGSPFSTGVPRFSDPSSLVADLTGRFLYATNLNFAGFAGNVLAFSIDPNTGTLTQLTDSPFPTGGSRSVSMARDSVNRFAFVADQFSNTVSAFRINNSTGALSLIPGSPFPTESTPGSVAVDPSGRFVYVANQGSSNISAFTIKNDGSLATIPGAPFAAGAGPISVTTTSAGARPPQASRQQKAGMVRNGYWVLDVNNSGQWDGSVIDRNFFWGQPGDVVITGDWNGSGTDKAGIVRADGSWVLDHNGNGRFDGANLDRVFSWGQAGDVPVVGDWNGSGTTKVGVIRRGQFGIQWILDYNGNTIWDGPNVDRAYLFGQTSDRPIVGDWNGSGITKVGLVRLGEFGLQWILDYNGNGTWDGSAVDRAYLFGANSDQIILGDWNGSGTTKVGVIRPGPFGLQWILDYNGNGIWEGPVLDRAYFFGENNDVAVTGDWNGTGTTKVGLVRAGQWILDFDGSSSWDNLMDRTFFWGQPGDIPVVGRW